MQGDTWQSFATQQAIRLNAQMNKDLEVTGKVIDSVQHRRALLQSEAGVNTDFKTLDNTSKTMNDN